MNETGVWENLHKVSLQDLQKKEKTDWSRAIVDTFSVRPVFGHSDKTKSHRHEKIGIKIPFSAIAKAPRSHRKSQQLIGTM